MNILKDRSFLVLIALFTAAIIIFRDQPVIAMWIGFALAGYSAIANDSIQTLGTFISSNRKAPWWVLWIFIGGIMSAVFLYGWFQGDVAFGRLAKIPEATELTYYHLFAPLILLVLTRYKMPVSTTFLLLAVFSDHKTIGKMLNKTFIGYFVAFLTAVVVWGFIAELKKRKLCCAKENYNQKPWRVLQWFATGYLWSSWLMQDTANVVVFLPRDISAAQITAIVVSLFFGIGYLLYRRGGRIQTIITEKSDVVDVRSATIIDFIFGTLLIIFKEWNNLPMSTTWVFLGMLAGREIALSRLFKEDKKYTKTLLLVTKDLSLASIGLVVSLAIAWAAHNAEAFFS